MPTSTSPPVRATYFGSRRDQDPASLAADELHQLRPSARRRLGPLVLLAVMVPVVLGGFFVQLERAAAVERAQVAMEMRDFEARAHALRAEMDALQDRIGQTREQLAGLQARPAPSAQAPAQTRPGNRPGAQASKPRPAPAAPARPATPRPAPIMLSPGCADTPLGC